MRELTLAVSSDDLELRAGAVVPDAPRGVTVLVHGIPSVTPELGDPGYPGFARELAERGWAALWGDMRAARQAPGYFSIAGWVRDVNALVGAARSLDAAEGLPVAVIGSSAGGVASAKAVADGVPVDALVLLAAPAVWVSFAADVNAGMRRIVDDAGMRLAPDVLANPDAWADEFRTITAEAAVASVKVPVLIVHGTDDDVVPVAHADALAAAAPDADVHILRGVSHAIRRDPQAVDLIAGWLEKVLS